MDYSFTNLTTFPSTFKKYTPLAKPETSMVSSPPPAPPKERSLFFWGGNTLIGNALSHFPHFGQGC